MPGVVRVPRAGLTIESLEEEELLLGVTLSLEGMVIRSVAWGL